MIVIPVDDKIVPALLSGGVWDLPETCCFSPGIPVGPMLAKPTKGVSEILDRFQKMEFTCEYKYDGERAQIHYLEDGSVQIYSRNAERNTEKFPDVVAASRYFIWIAFSASNEGVVGRARLWVKMSLF
ncbi:putative DNA ligase (ATP) [Helianthus anomalus]